MSSSLSSAETLPTEVLSFICESLDYSGLAALLQCSKYLYRRVKPTLYLFQDAQELALRWGCEKGNLQLIQLAVSYGASVVTVKRRSTLQLAAKGGHVEAFELLLTLGARLDHRLGVEQGRRFSQLLCSPGKDDILLVFLKAGFLSHPTIDLSIPTVIRSGGSPEVVRAILVADIDVNRHERWHKYGRKHIIVTPLSTAILENAMPIFDVLIQKGASIHGTERCNPFGKMLPYPWREPLHLPVFAAAQSMHKYGVAMMQRCLDLGADINYRSHTRSCPTAAAVYTTPLLMYLASIDSWSPDGVELVLRPIDGVAFFLRHKAILEIPHYSEHRRIQDEAVSSISTIEVLFDKWGLEKLADPEFFETIEFLVKNGAGREHVTGILINYAIEPEGFNLDLLKYWERFVDLLINRPLKSDEPNPVDNYALLKEILLPPWPYKVVFGELHRTTVRCLLRAGADINAHIGYDGLTILHEVCSRRRVINHPQGCNHEDIESCWRAKRIFSFFAFLFQIGANPRIVVMGKTPLDILLEPCRRSYRFSEMSKAYYMRLGNILLGKKDTYDLAQLYALDISPRYRILEFDEEIEEVSSV